MNTIHSAEEKKRHAIAKATKKLKQEQDIALDELAVSIDLHSKKEERLTRLLWIELKPYSSYPNPNNPYPTRQLQATLEDKISSEQSLKRQFQENEREKDKALKVIGQERRKLDVERYFPTRTVHLSLALFLQLTPNLNP